MDGKKHFAGKWYVPDGAFLVKNISSSLWMMNASVYILGMTPFFLAKKSYFVRVFFFVKKKKIVWLEVNKYWRIKKTF